MIPRLSLDPFEDAVLADPHPAYGWIRDAGPVVFLDSIGAYAMSRHAEVSAALRDHETFCSGRGVGLLDFNDQERWRQPSLLLETDPPLHDRTRKIMNRVVSPANLKAVRAHWQQQAVELIEPLVQQRRFDAISELAELYPLRVFPDTIGLQQEGRENLLVFAKAMFDTFGPRNRLFLESSAEAVDAIGWINESRQRDKLSKSGWGALVFEAADRGECTEDEASQLVRAFLAAGVDTTINGIGNLLYALALHPAQYAKLRQDPRLLPRAIEEGLRWDSTVKAFFRTTTRAVEIGGDVIPADAKVLLFLAGANRDPRRWENADEFDISRQSSGHVAFGFGVHQCLGQMVARLEAELVMTEFMKRVTALRIVGEPKRRLNNALHALASLPVEIDAG